MEQKNAWVIDYFLVRLNTFRLKIQVSKRLVSRREMTIEYGKLNVQISRTLVLQSSDFRLLCVRFPHR